MVGFGSWTASVAESLNHTEIARFGTHHPNQTITTDVIHSDFTADLIIEKSTMLYIDTRVSLHLHTTPTEIGLASQYK